MQGGSLLMYRNLGHFKKNHSQEGMRPLRFYLQCFNVRWVLSSSTSVVWEILVKKKIKKIKNRNAKSIGYIL